MHITMIGAGYVGLVSGACLADIGHKVICVDKDPAKIAMLRSGRMPIYEAGLDDLVARNVAAGRLAFADDLGAPVAQSQAVFIAVGTPPRKSDGHADLSYVFQAAREIAGALRGFATVVVKSTVPVGTGDDVERLMRETRPDADFAVVSNPEFLREGDAIADFMHPDRIVVGAGDERGRAAMADVYAPLTNTGAPLLLTNRRTAEIIKYAANGFLVTKITFINEIADLCERVGGDVQDVARGIGLDNRIGQKFLNAGPGYGGSCFPKDTLALAQIAQGAGVSLRIIETATAVNNQRRYVMARKVIAACGGSVRGLTLGVLGLTFKADTDDMRESPATGIIRALLDAGAAIRAYDPAGAHQAREVLPDIELAQDPYDCIAGADCAVVITEWAEFRGLDLARVKASLRRPVLVDLRNIFTPEQARRHGLSYVSVGRGEA
ncbi:MAG: UDP-glucose/GDP-mannose dehydrogenase family protein [Hyphomicrobiaceae bacterium]